MKIDQPVNFKHRTPNLWWDYGEDCIIVETNNDKYPIIARIKYDAVNGGVPATKEMIDMFGCKRIGQAGNAITFAQNLIYEVNSGRLTIKACYERYGKNAIKRF